MNHHQIRPTPISRFWPCLLNYGFATMAVIFGSNSLARADSSCIESSPDQISNCLIAQNSSTSSQSLGAGTGGFSAGQTTTGTTAGSHNSGVSHDATSNALAGSERRLGGTTASGSSSSTGSDSKSPLGNPPPGDTPAPKSPGNNWTTAGAPPQGVQGK